MTSTAGFGNVKMIDGRFRKASSQYLMSRSVGGMAIVARSRKINSAERSLGVYAVFEKFHRMLH
jgi:hypothetical protein